MLACRESTARTRLNSMMEEPPVNYPGFDLSFEEITANIQRLKQAQITHPVQVPNEYLEGIQRVNDALCQGARTAIRVHHHSLTCPPGGVPFPPGGAFSSCPPPEGCLLILNKIVVTSAQFAQSHLYSISLQFWDDTRAEQYMASDNDTAPVGDDRSAGRAVSGHTYLRGGMRRIHRQVPIPSTGETSAIGVLSIRESRIYLEITEGRSWQRRQ